MEITTVARVSAENTPEQLTVLLHGYGADGANLIDLGHLWARKFPSIEFIAPNAPSPCEQGMGYQWTSLQNYNPVQMEKEVRALFPHFKKYLDQELEKYSLNYKNLILMGFSQGANLALEAAQMLAEKNDVCAGVMAYAGWMFLSTPFPAGFPPTLLVHGTADTVVPITESSKTAQFLKNKGVNVTFHACKDLGHSIDNVGLQKGQEFLHSALKLDL